MIEQIRDYFREQYAYINLQELTDQQLLDFIEAPHIKGLPFTQQMDYLRDWILSQDLAEVTE
ncbi:MAG TPA: hypothetical protein HA367_06110 [Candidatus Methanofastidiosum sp.]|nr:hypothetical protein [Methanofastidiosum sp.]